MMNMIVKLIVNRIMILEWKASMTYMIHFGSRQSKFLSRHHSLRV